MSVSIVGRRYAKALFALAEQQGVVEPVGTALREFAASFDESRELQSVFENPSFGAKERATILDNVAKAAKLPPLLVKALHMLADRGRMRYVGEVAEAYASRAESASGRVNAEVTTAADLGDAYFVELQKALQLVTGKDVTLTRKTDPTLLGGVVTRIGDQVFDGSIKHRLAGLKDELLR